jgi:hypothetical protein
MRSNTPAYESQAAAAKSAMSATSPQRMMAAVRTPGGGSWRSSVIVVSFPARRVAPPGAGA